eukprot:CAMPEP_0201488650 /NCGR_PEP_ID=MMETSP0151_2-20130828/19297_1 /ASSEMBLY_ACC=CAM_ASM_000257 /TAXON_ID=200890 /ORGANISM="Paramoeba atlantica, Strain 621/1 / CCAP 1560/9" /LENGTH=251 /DNA_ID=CAMNT_0047873981 /DNA_START=130 /DNA_END=885 /DNA_ORIENTATION=-
MWQQNDTIATQPSYFDFSAQGVAHINSDYLIFTGKDLLRRTNQPPSLSSLTTIVVNHSPLKELPPGLSLDHIGDGDVFENDLYLPIEGVGYVNPSIAIYDAMTLKFTGTIIQATEQIHCPWVVYWEGVLLSSEFDNVTHLTVYNATTLLAEKSLVIGFSNGGTILYPNGLQHIQGGALLSNGMLLLSSSDTNQPLITIDLEEAGGGIVGAEELQYTKTGGEMEGITSPPDGSLYSVVNHDVYDEITKYVPI